MLTVAILGASEKEERYSNKAQRRLMEAGHKTFPVSKDGKDVLGVEGFSSLADINEKIDTVTVYLRPQLLDEVLDDVLAAKPRRVIFNPGTESKPHQEKLEAQGIKVVEACSLVLLSLGSFETA